MKANPLGLEVAIDLEIRSLWERLLEEGEFDCFDEDELAHIGCFMRAAWAQGAAAACRSSGRVKKVVREHGFHL